MPNSHLNLPYRHKDKADRKLFKQIRLFEDLAFLIPRIRLDPQDVSSPCPNQTLFCIRLCSLIDVCLSIFSSILPPCCVVFFLLRYLC